MFACLFWAAAGKQQENMVTSMRWNQLLCRNKRLILQQFSLSGDYTLMKKELWRADSSGLTHCIQPFVTLQQLRPYFTFLKFVHQVSPLFIFVLRWMRKAVFQLQTYPIRKGSSLEHRCYWFYVTEVLIDLCGHTVENRCSFNWDTKTSRTLFVALCYLKSITKFTYSALVSEGFPFVVHPCTFHCTIQRKYIMLPVIYVSAA